MNEVKTCDNCKYKSAPRCLLSPYISPVDCVADGYTRWCLNEIVKKGET